MISFAQSAARSSSPSFRGPSESLTKNPSGGIISPPLKALQQSAKGLKIIWLPRQDDFHNFNYQGSGCFDNKDLNLLMVLVFIALIFPFSEFPFQYCFC